ncbi:MAG TPA: nucleotidyl transferase AbiEii/AbiGii toxin family protein, partial [bacterium]|nr:nucleotidyl transferase AbiEii/AbiGii toxin family protein [bacterium]
ISPLLGFKGDTCTYFFYILPRFPVDLKVDVLEVTEENQKMVFEKIVAILSKYGTIKDQYIKRFTVFALLSYGDEDHNVKVEINVRKLAENMKDLYEMKEYLGISMMVAKKDYLFAGKLAALTLRTETAMRDIFDIQYFAKNHWDINAEVIKNFTGKTVKEYLPDCVAFIEKVKDSQMLQGLGELIDNEKQKDWVRNHLKADAIFMLKNYQSVLK